MADIIKMLTDYAANGENPFAEVVAFIAKAIEFIMTL